MNCHSRLPGIQFGKEACSMSLDPRQLFYFYYGAMKFDCKVRWGYLNDVLLAGQIPCDCTVVFRL